MAESILFLTGHLARARLEAVLRAMKVSFDWKVLDIGVKVAALMTEDIIARRLPSPVDADKVMLPGRCRMKSGPSLSRCSYSARSSSACPGDLSVA